MRSPPTASWPGPGEPALRACAPRPASACAAAALLALLPGCGLLADLGAGTLVGPDYETPPTPTADAWIDYRDARVPGEEAELRTWWTVFGDPVLDGLMRQAAAQNLSLQAAVERVAAARARRDLAAGFMAPQEQGASGAVSGVRSSEETANFPPTPFDRTTQDWRADAFATWEIDFWGRYRRAVESADAELQASLADHDDVLVLLYAELASRYVSYRTFQGRLRYLRANEAIQLAAYELTRARFDAGEVAERDIHEARQILEETRSLIPEAEIGLRLENNALCTLRGLPPRDLSAELGEAPIPGAPASVAVGIPADLLRRRPDVRRAERLAAARCALIGIAESDYYPRLGIAGSLGVQAEHGADLDDSGARTSLLSAGFTWSILDWGRTASNVRAFEAEFRAAALEYQQAVLEAGRQAEDALVALVKTQERLAPQRAAAQAALRTVEIVQDQYAEGEVDFSDVFVFASNLTQQQDRLARAEGDAAQALIGVYRALGGGWDAPDPAQDGESP
jgi:NodT family efflux transporter outer membrane factor (OMF) lipoprotein